MSVETQAAFFSTFMVGLLTMNAALLQVWITAHDVVRRHALRVLWRNLSVTFSKTGDPGDLVIKDLGRAVVAKKKEGKGSGTTAKGVTH